MSKIRLIFVILILTFFCNGLSGQRTYCNPLNLDYGYCPIPNFTESGKHRATADPVIVLYKGDYYLFSTNQWGYWWSTDLNHWNFISKSFLKPYHKVYDDLCAPAVWVQGDTLLVFGSTYSDNFPIWMSTNPKSNDWKEAIDAFNIGGWDPDFFTDDDGKLYMYNGSSNAYPLYGVEVDRKTFVPLGARKELLLLNGERLGWQRFGEYSDNTFLDAFIEGAWMTKHDGRYFLQYGAPGTEISGYADGVAVSDKPLGNFVHQSMPFSYKPGGFARGAGHGSTFQDKWDNYWHVSTISISVKNSFERRLGLWPAGFDKDPQPVEARYIKLENLHMPTGKFAISGSRVFGSGHGSKPDPVSHFIVLRTEKDKRSAWLKWTPVDNAYAYNIYLGAAPDKLYNCIMVYGANEYWLKAMDKEIPYFFRIEAINENGVSQPSQIIKSE
jgi:hypothetical protein